MTRGWGKIYFHEEVGEDGLTDFQRKFQAEAIASEKKIDEMIQKEIDAIDIKKILLEEETSPTVAIESKEVHTKTHTRSSSAMLPTRASTLKARSAAAALSRPGSSATVRSDGTRSSSTTTKTRQTPTVPVKELETRHAVARASSRTTLGYSKGRSVSSVLSPISNKETEVAKRHPQPKAVIAPETYIQLYGAPPVGSEMWQRCEDAGCLPKSEASIDHDEVLALPFLEEDEEALNFQLSF